LISVPDTFCYANASRYTRKHQDEGVVYAEGLAQTRTGLQSYLPHAWVVLPDGTALDPTWDDATGRAYFGVPVTDPRRWPRTNQGLLENYETWIPLLRDGIPPDAIADLGRPASYEDPEQRDIPVPAEPSHTSSAPLPLTDTGA
jgi:hypothetical protein